MNDTLRVLFIEDSEDDMLLQLRELKRAGYEVRSERVQTAEQLRHALTHHPWDVILSDYALPGFTGIDALRLLQASRLDIPFILISGTVGEETAVESMKAGAADYLLKDSLTRLVPAVRRELRDAADRRRRRKAEADLRENQALLALIYDHTDEMLALFAADTSGAYQLASINRAWRDLAARLGYHLCEDDERGLTLDEVLAGLQAAPEVAGRLRKGFREAVAQGRPITFDLEWRRGEQVLHLEQHLIPVIQTNGSSRHLLWSSRDVSERMLAEDQKRRLEAQLMHAQKLEALGTMASGIAHDFNNILAGLSGYVEIVRADTRGHPHVQETINLILQGIHRATDLVRRILAFSRKRTVLRRPMHLGPVVHEALQFLRPLVPLGVAVQVHLPADCPAVVADAGQMHQVVVNLCTNAMHAMNEQGGLLEVSLEPVTLAPAFASAHPPLAPGGHVRVTVRDSGTGMDEITLGRLFEPFFTTKPAGVGTGLGLAVVQGIVRSHQGGIVVSSKPGKGTTFDLYFPVADLANADPQASRPGQGEHILFVDDEDYLARMGEALLERLGYRVTAFTDPEKAYAAFAADTQGYAALITDLTMPVLKGTDLACLMRALRPDLPVILTTGFSGPHEMDRARRLGFDRMLEKPFTVEKFVDLLRQALPQAG